jgi:hypothetical protein
MTYEPGTNEAGERYNSLPTDYTGTRARSPRPARKSSPLKLPKARA